MSGASPHDYLLVLIIWVQRYEKSPELLRFGRLFYGLLVDASRLSRINPCRRAHRLRPEGSFRRQSNRRCPVLNLRSSRQYRRPTKILRRQA